MKEDKYEHPLILIFYLDRELMKQREIMQSFADSVNQDILDRGANIMAYFIPTDDDERIECINPLIATDEEKVTIKALIDDISKNFDINQGTIVDE